MVLHAPPQTLSKLLAHRDGVKVTTRMSAEMYWPHNTEPYIWPPRVPRTIYVKVRQHVHFSILKKVMEKALKGPVP